MVWDLCLYNIWLSEVSQVLELVSGKLWFLARLPIFNRGTMLPKNGEKRLTHIHSSPHFHFVLQKVSINALKSNIQPSHPQTPIFSRVSFMTFSCAMMLMSTISLYFGLYIWSLEGWEFKFYYCLGMIHCMFYGAVAWFVGITTVSELHVLSIFCHQDGMPYSIICISNHQ